MPRISEYITAESLTLEQWEHLCPGDRLRCVSADGCVTLDAGETYTLEGKRVTANDECFVALEETGGKQFFAGRFTLVEAQHTDALLKAFQGA